MLKATTGGSYVYIHDLVQHGYMLPSMNQAVLNKENKLKLNIYIFIFIISSNMATLCGRRTNRSWLWKRQNHNKSPWAGFELTTLVVIGTDCYYHTIVILKPQHIHVYTLKFMMALNISFFIWNWHIIPFWILQIQMYCAVLTKVDQHEAH